MTDERIKEEFGLFMARSVPIRDIDLSRTLTSSVGDVDNTMIQSHAVGFIGGLRTAERLAKIEALEEVLERSNRCYMAQSVREEIETMIAELKAAASDAGEMGKEEGE